MTDIDVVWDADRQVARIQRNRPIARDALNRTTLKGLARAIADIDATASCRLLILEPSVWPITVGVVRHPWSDREQFADLPCLPDRAIVGPFARLDIPVIAMIDGPALDSGLELALACDLRLASDRATFGLPGARLANGVGWGCLSRLVPLVGPSLARELVLTGRIFDAEEAMAIGLLTAVHPSDRLAAATAELTAQLLNGDRLPLLVGKQIIEALSRIPAPGSFEASSGAAFPRSTDARADEVASVTHRPATGKDAPRSDRMQR